VWRTMCLACSVKMSAATNSSEENFEEDFHLVEAGKRPAGITEIPPLVERVALGPALVLVLVPWPLAVLPAVLVAA
jgi:hypothetical protein